MLTGLTDEHVRLLEAIHRAEEEGVDATLSYLLESIYDGEPRCGSRLYQLTRDLLSSFLIREGFMHQQDRPHDGMLMYFFLSDRGRLVLAELEARL